MSQYKITPFLSDIKTFFKSDMTAAMQSISHFPGSGRMTERSTIGITTKVYHLYRLLEVFQCLIMFPWFGLRNLYRAHLDNAWHLSWRAAKMWSTT